MGKKTLPLILVMHLMLASCSSSDDEAELAKLAERPIHELYEEAWNSLASNKYKKAMTAFEEVERQYPYSEWATRAKIMYAYAAYKDEDYDKAIPALENFVKMHPANTSTPYAYYLIALSYYNQISDVARDQEITENTLLALEDVIGRFPDSDYARDAKIKKDLVIDHLAGKEMEIGRYYLQRNELVAAVNRFKYVVDSFQTTSHTPEALHRLTECYLILGVEDQAKKYAAVLGHNYPGNKWYQRSYNLLTGQSGEPEKGWFERNLKGFLK